ncbi:MAG: hypothetical protein RIT14_1385 [Pseudomonadota bacterium]
MDAPTALAGPCPPSLILCFSHLRWDLVFQRPQHLLTRAALRHQVIYLEEPLREAGRTPCLRIRRDTSGVKIATPILPQDCADPVAAQRVLLDALLRAHPHQRLTAWYYTPMALEFSGHLSPDLTVYDCMDELSAFQNPPPGLTAAEDRLFRRADIVFTGGYSLFEAKRHRHPRVHAVPSSVDAEHFGRARGLLRDPDDQRAIAHPRIGFFGVIDERMDLDLVARAVTGLPGVQFVMLGPVVKIDPRALPRTANLHWLGTKSYAALPAYLANWDAGWMPFALNDSTRFISPTKTPEFLAAGLPLVSTAVPDVVRGYGAGNLVRIVGAQDIVPALQAVLAPPATGWRAAVERHLGTTSWDATWVGMEAVMRAELERQALRRRAVLPRGLTPFSAASGMEASDA